MKTPLKKLHKGDENQRRSKIIDISRTRDPRYVPQLLARLSSDETAENKRHIVRALGNIGDGRAEEKLLEMLETAGGQMLGDVVRSLGQLKSQKAVPRIRALLEHEIEWVRQNAAWAVGGDCGPPPVVAHPKSGTPAAAQYAFFHHPSSQLPPCRATNPPPVGPLCPTGPYSLSRPLLSPGFLPAF